MDRLLEVQKQQDRVLGLDGMRGIAALIVLLSHSLWEFCRISLFSEGYLSVDLFFMLSGLVIARGWESRIMTGELSPALFMRARFARFYPVMLLGAVLGSLSWLINGVKLQNVAACLMLQAAFIPQWWSNGPIFPINSVQWSLLFELCANFIHTKIIKFMNINYTAISLFFLSIMLFIVSRVDKGLAVGDYGYRFTGGLPRVMFSYIAGVSLYRLSRTHGHIRWPKFDWRIVSIIFVAVVIIAGCATAYVPKSFIDPIIVVFIWPAILWMGLYSYTSERCSVFAKTLGDISFPLYATHVPILGLAEALRHRESHMSSYSCFEVAIIMSISFAFLVKFAFGGLNITSVRP